MRQFVLGVLSALCIVAASWFAMNQYSRSDAPPATEKIATEEIHSQAVVDNDAPRPMDGVWSGTSILRRIVLVVRDDKMLFIHPTGPAESTFRLHFDAIDIDRYDGQKQIGVYRANDSTLNLTLADPGVKNRPDKIYEHEINKPGAGVAIFNRKVTPEGLETLQANIARNPSLTLTDTP